MNEQINIFLLILCIVCFLTAVFLGAFLYINGDRNKELEFAIKDSIRRGQLVKDGLGFCIRQSVTQLQDFRDLQGENKSFGDAEERRRKETERTLEILRQKNREDDRLREESQSRIRGAEERCGEIERQLRESQNIIKNATKQPDN